MSDSYSSPGAEIPDLHVLPLERLIKHEHFEAQHAAPLTERLQAEGTLRNPPIVAPLSEGDSRRVVLDGSNRIAALRALRYEHVIAQQVNYEPPRVRLKTWRHVVTGIRREQFTADLKTIAKLDLPPLTETESAEALGNVDSALRRNLLARVIHADGQAFSVRAKHGASNLHTYTRLLNALVETYQTRGRLFRATTDNVDEVRRLYPELTALVIFPTLEASQVLALVRAGELLPAGVTRHLIQGRALRLDYPLRELRSPDSLETKESHLQDWLRHKLAEKQIRFYGEATYLFDE